MRHPLAAPFCLSLALHLAVLLAPDLRLSATPPPLQQPIEVLIKRPAVQRVLEQPQEAPPPEMKKEVAEKTVAPPQKIAVSGGEEKTAPLPPENPPVLNNALVPELAKQDSSQGDGMNSEAKHEEAAADEPFRLPPSGVIRYTIFYVDQDGPIIGRSRSEWSIRNGGYRIVSNLETAGLAALFRDSRIEYESVGLIAPEGLRPQRFTSRRNGEDRGENASFDWDRKTVRVGRDNAESPLAPGAQDLLSLQYQLGWIPEILKGIDLPVATGKKFNTYHVEVLGQELLSTPLGLLRTLHTRSAGDDVTELWLAIDLRLLPIKIRFTDRDSHIFESIADEVTFSGEQASPGADPPPVPPEGFFSSRPPPDKSGMAGGSAGRPPAQIFRPPDNLY
ncbi:MAG: DUF3108 domain-containing protein [Betaproteobacteria bacterium]|nr:DUF3108 domain-containing protein [Betaproteobacteria bacterium]